MRRAAEHNNSPQNFNGTFAFGGGLAPVLNAANQPVLDASGQQVTKCIDSIESYRHVAVSAVRPFVCSDSRAGRRRHAVNLTNHNNPGAIIVNIASPLFGHANQPAGSGGGLFSESANNRRLELQMRLTF